jgi:hypothetical protein
MNTKELAESLREFWISVRTAARMMSPKATVDSPKLDANQYERILRQADLWLTPRAVAGFERANLEFLDNEERKQLMDCVEHFRDTAAQVPPAAPASNEQVQAARPSFQCILEILRPDKYGDSEALVIGKQLEQALKGRLPPWCQDFRIETGEDANGDSAIWIWVEVDDSAIQKDVLTANFGLLQEQIEGTLRQLGVERWPYIRLRTVSEQRSAEKKAKK